MSRDGELLSHLHAVLKPALGLHLAGLALPKRLHPKPCHREPGGAGGGDPYRVRRHPCAVAQEAAGAAIRGALRLRGPQRRRADSEGGRQAVGAGEAGGLRAGQEAHRISGVRPDPRKLRGSAAGRVRQTQVSDPDLTMRNRVYPAHLCWGTEVFD